MDKNYFRQNLSVHILTSEFFNLDLTFSVRPNSDSKSSESL